MLHYFNFISSQLLRRYVSTIVPMTQMLLQDYPKEEKDAMRLRNASPKSGSVKADWLSFVRGHPEGFGEHGSREIENSAISSKNTETTVITTEMQDELRE